MLNLTPPRHTPTLPAPASASRKYRSFLERWLKMGPIDPLRSFRRTGRLGWAFRLTWRPQEGRYKRGPQTRSNSGRRCRRIQPARRRRRGAHPRAAPRLAQRSDRPGAQPSLVRGIPCSDGMWARDLNRARPDLGRRRDMGDPGRWGCGVPNIHNRCETTAAQPAINQADARRQLALNWPFASPMP